MKYSEYFGRRKNTFEESYNHVVSSMKEKDEYTIVELGSSRSFVTGGKPGCMNPDVRYWNPDRPEDWDWGAGVFTKVFAENLKDKNCKIYTVDPDNNANFIVSTMCKDYKNVNIYKGYSTDFLKSFSDKIDLLYMDHMETSEASAIQHLEDIKLVINNKLMSENGIILIDDIGGDSTNGKGKYSIPYLLNEGYKKSRDEYQVLMVKDSNSR